MGGVVAQPDGFVGIVCAAGVLGLLGVTEPALSYAPATHREIGTAAVDRSDLDAILRTRYRVDGGAAFFINGETVQTWIAIGAAREDVPGVRSVNHFHSPLKPWPNAGGLLGQSSIYWQQNPEQGIGGTWSWAVARQRFFDFLTLPAPAARAQALADTARALGQLMHMVQDAASPAHTREDPHLIHDGYEARIEELRRSSEAPLRARFQDFLTAPSTLPATSIFTVTGDPQAPVPVARLIDTDRFAGTVQSYSTGAEAGLAEYTSGGYVSDDTIFLGFALPRRESLGVAAADPPETPGARRYFPMTTDGDTITHFVAEGALYERLLLRGQLVGGFMLDDKVYEDYATRLIPRAVGYWAGLLNYFFRSNFDFTVDPSSSDPAKRLLTISIPPDLTAETMDGTFTLYAENEDGVRSAVAGASITTALSRGGLVQAVFTPGSGVRAYVLAFRGRLGDESGAVTGKVKPLGPLVSAIQATAEFTGAEARTTLTEVDNASTLIIVERRSKDERQQRARGAFFSSTGNPGQHLKRVSLEFDARVVGTPPARLLLDDIAVGVAWDRGGSIVESPSRWEVRIDLPAFYGGAGGLVPNVPRALAVETIEGLKIRTPLVWWRSASSLGEARASRESATTCPAELACEEVISNSTLLNGRVFFGDGNGEGRDATSSGQRQPVSLPHTSVGFIPAGVVAGYGVGTVEQSGNLNCFAGCTPTASCSTSTVGIFAESGAGEPVWIKDEFSVSLGSLNGVRKPATACARPAAGQPAAPELPELRFRRDYLPAEQSRFQEFGAIPPEHEIILR
jgi:hypothetical protein